MLKFLRWSCPLLALVPLIACAGPSTEREASPSRESAASAATRTDDRLQSWSGNYEFTDTAGKTVGGTVPVVTYRLAIDERTPSRGTLNIVGFQTTQKLQCDVSGNSDQIAVAFRSYESGRTENEFGVSVYQPHQVLFTLQRAGDNKQELVTNWQALKPDGVEATSGKYFVRAGAKSN